MYGNGNPDAAPAPPVPQDSASNAVIVPSAATPTLTRAAADGRFPVARCSSLRSSISLTGAFACFASRAQMIACGSCAPSLLPNPPPMYCVITRTFDAGIFSPVANPSLVALTPCVDTHAVKFSPSHSQTAPCDSRHTCVITCVEYVSSSVCVACLKPAATSPVSCVCPCLTLLRGVPGVLSAAGPLAANTAGAVPASA